MSVFDPNKFRESVLVPGVGPMQRVEVRSPDGELPEVRYRRPEPTIG